MRRFNAFTDCLHDNDGNVYGTTGYALIDDAETIRYRLGENSNERVDKVSSSAAPFRDPFTFFASAIKGEIKINPTDLSSPEINLTVVEILEAARKSSKTGKKVKLSR